MAAGQRALLLSARSFILYENSVNQNPEEFRIYMPIIARRCIQERTGQVIKLKRVFTATIAKSLSIKLLQPLIIAATYLLKRK